MFKKKFLITTLSIGVLCTGLYNLLDLNATQKHDVKHLTNEQQPTPYAPANYLTNEQQPTPYAPANYLANEQQPTPYAPANHLANEQQPTPYVLIKLTQV